LSSRSRAVDFTRSATRLTTLGLEEKRYEHAKPQKATTGDGSANLRTSQTPFAGRKRLSLGPGQGIDKSIAVALTKAGADVVVNYVDGKRAANEVILRTYVNVEASPRPLR
jgi:glucose 1-dehydrogenase